LQPAYFWFLAWPTCRTWSWRKVICSSEMSMDIYKARQGYKEDTTLRRPNSVILYFCVYISSQRIKSINMNK
jgi:hypothetical protein